MDVIENLLDEAGIPVAIEHRGEPRRLPPVVGRGAYRVIRDALRAARSASVAIEFMPGALAVQVDADGEGRDLDEVAELAAALGGGLRTVLRPGGFRVRAWLPTEGQPPCPAVPLAVH
ncbi:MAG TPA: hypothetical protein VFZ00_02640 [Solirubrobacter sp.]|nr:hypothetical protein [Solirubrobacter sp.]